MEFIHGITSLIYKQLSRCMNWRSATSARQQLQLEPKLQLLQQLSHDDTPMQTASTAARSAIRRRILQLNEETFGDTPATTSTSAVHISDHRRLLRLPETTDISCFACSAKMMAFPSTKACTHSCYSSHVPIKESKEVILSTRVT